MLSREKCFITGRPCEIGSNFRRNLCAKFRNIRKEKGEEKEREGERNIIVGVLNPIREFLCWILGQAVLLSIFPMSHLRSSNWSRPSC